MGGRIRLLKTKTTKDEISQQAKYDNKFKISINSIGIRKN